jgi:hypothetical protein
MGGQGWILLLPFLGFSYGTVSESEAVITCLEDMAVVGETVEESGRHLGVAEDSGPLQHWQQRLPWLQPEDYASPGGNAGGGGASRTPCTAGPVAVPQGTLGVQAANWLCAANVRFIMSIAQSGSSPSGQTCSFRSAPIPVTARCKMESRKRT